MARRVDDWFGAYSAEAEEGAEPEEPQPEGEQPGDDNADKDNAGDANKEAGGEGATPPAPPPDWYKPHVEVDPDYPGRYIIVAGGQRYGQPSWDLGAQQSNVNKMLGEGDTTARDPQLAAIEAQMRAMSASRLQPLRLPSMPSMPTVGGLGQLDPQIQLMQQELLRMQLAEQARQAQRVQQWAIARDMMAKEEANRMARGYVSSGYFRDPEAQAWARAREMLR